MNPNLNQQQFMSVKDLGGYESMDYPGKTMDQVHDMFRGRERTSPRFHEKMEDLRGSVEDYGMKQPIFVNEEEHMVGNGHHRFSAGKSLRMGKLPVTHKMIDSVGGEE